MRELVADDPLELLPVELLEQPCRDRDRGVLRIAPGGERVGRGVVDDVDLRHRHVRGDRHLAHDVHELRRLRLIDLTGAAHGEDQRIAGEVRECAAQRADEHRDDRRADPALGRAEHSEADREAEQREEDDDERRHEERVPPVGGDLVVEG